MELLNRICLGIAALMLFVMTLIGAADIVSAYVFSWPLPAVYEVSEMLMAVVVFMAMSSLQRLRMSISIDLLYERFSDRWKQRVTVFSYLCGAIFFGLIAWQGWLLTLEAWQVREYAQGPYPVPVYPAKFLFAIGATIVVIQCAFDIYRHLIGRDDSVLDHSAIESDIKRSLE